MKKSVVKFISACVRGGVLALSSLLVFSCGEDSGLGASVDTEAPKIEITYPPLAACIRDTFKLAGTCDDDKNISKILITVTDTNTKEPVDTVIATIDSDGKKWQADINPFDSESQKYKYGDGNYQFTAEAHDGAGHKTSASRSFDLDNSAPVFVISKPGVIKSENKKASAYGSNFTVEGTIADDHTISTLTAKIYSAEDGSLIGEYSEEDISTAGGTSVTIAEHSANGQKKMTAQNERYTEVYGEDDGAGTKNFYATVLLSDSAKSYTNPEEEENTSEGNTSSRLYLYDSVYTKLMSKKKGIGLSVSDMMQILKGAVQNDVALDVLKESVIDTGNEGGEDKDANKLLFSLNPMANPTYNVNGFSIKTDKDGNPVYVEASSGNTVTVTASSGLDGTAILPGRVKIWTVDINDQLGDDEAVRNRIKEVAAKVKSAELLYTEDAEEDKILEGLKEKSTEIISAVEGAFNTGVVKNILDNSSDNSASEQTFTVSGTLPEETYTAGRIYAVIVTGCDVDDVEFSHENFYVFKASEAIIPPTLEMTEPDNLAFIKSSSGADLCFIGKVYMPKDSTLNVGKIEVLLTVKNENERNVPVGDEGGYFVTAERKEDGTYTFSDDALTYAPATSYWTFKPENLDAYDAIKAIEDSGKSYLYQLDVTAYSNETQNIKRSLSVHVDTTKPLVTIANVTPYVDGSQFYGQTGDAVRNYVNGDITVKFNVEETNLKEVFYKVEVDGEEKVPETSLGKVFSGTIPVKTTNWTSSDTEKKAVVVTLWAVDECGNIGSKTTSEYNKEINNNDNPFIICQETDKPQINFGNAEYSYDDGGVQKSLLVTDNAETNAANAKNVIAGHNLFNVEGNNFITINLSDDDGLAWAQVTVWDEKGNLVAANDWNDVESPTNPRQKQLSGSTSDSWKYVLPHIEGVFRVQVEVNDTKLEGSAGSIAELWRKNASKKFFIAIDNGAPTVEVKSPVSGSYNPKVFGANGTVAEKENVIFKREIYKVAYDSAQDKEVETLVAGSTLDVTSKIGAKIASGTDNGKYSWSEDDSDITIEQDGNYLLRYTATDRYMQKASASVRIIIDTLPPVFKDSDSSVSATSEAVKGTMAVSQKWYNSEALNLKGELTEANGISGISYWLDVETSEDPTGSFTAATENGISSYKTTVSGFIEQSEPHKLTLIAEDLAGNKSEPITYSIKVDMTPPKFEKPYYTMGTVKKDAQGEVLTNGKNDINLYGQISDSASGVQSLGLYLDKNELIPASEIAYTTSSLPESPTADELVAWYEGTAEWGAAGTVPPNATAWKAVIAKEKLSAEGFTGGEIRANYSDIAGNTTKNFLMFTLAVDTTPPALASQILEDKTPKFTAYRSDTKDSSGNVTAYRYFVNNSESHKFVLSGVATDNRGIASVALKVGNGIPESKNTTGDYNFDDLDLHSLGNGDKLTLIVTDNAANITETEITIIPDVTAPQGEHKKTSATASKPEEDMQFRIGEAANDQYATTSAEADKDVGLKYSPGTYGNTNSIRIRGNFAENGSGLDMIYYLRTTVIPDETTISNFLKDYENLKTGYFAPSSEEIKNVANADGTYEEIKTNYKTLLSGFGEGSNYLVLVAVDKVGNAALDTPPFEGTSNYFSINVDTVVPEVEENVNVEIDGSSDGLSASQILTNFEKGNITLSGKASDADSGIKSVVLYVEGKGSKTAGGSVAIDKNTTGSSIAATLTAGDSGDSEGTKKWSGEIAASLFSEVASGTFAVYATVKDNAGDGNMVNRSVATIIVDKTKPTVELKNPADADSATSSVIEINGIIDLSGEISDGNILPDTAITAIQYTTNTSASADSDMGWQTLSADSHAGMDDFALSGNYTFSARNFDTSKLTEDTVYYLRAKATDKAGNVGYSAPVTVKVDQDTDRPLIKFSTMDEADAIISSQTIKGTLSDDDGSVTSFKYKDGEAAGWTEITVQSGEWTINDLAGGSHSLKFQITDAKGTVFETEKTEGKFAADGMPYVLYAKADSVKAKNSAASAFKIDLNAPSVQSMEIASTETKSAPDTDAYASGRTKSFGTNARYMWLKVIAKEDVALNDDFAKDVSLKVGKNTITLTKDTTAATNKITRTGTIGTADTDPGFTYIIGPIDTSSITEEGTLTVAIVVTDKSGRASDALTGTIFIDKTAPEVTVTSPNLTDGASTDSIVGTTVLRGQASDSSVITKFFYIIPDSTTKTKIDTAGYIFDSNDGWKDMNAVENSKGALNDYTEHTALMWEIPVTSSKFVTESTDGLSLIEYATAKDGDELKYALSSDVPSSASADNGADGKKCVYVPLYFYTEDETGMAKVTPTKILVDPYAGIPQLEIATPEDFAKTGGNLNFQGSVTDDAGDADKVVLTKLEFSTVDAVEADFVGSTAKDDSTFEWKEVTRDILAETEVVTKGTLSATDATITAEGKPSSWKISINTSAISTDKAGNLATLLGTQGAGDDEEAKDIKIARATFVAYDKNGTASTFQVETLANKADEALVKNVFVDKNAPKMKNIQLVQYDDGTGSDPEDIEISDIPSISRSYTAGMYVSGKTGTKQWYLKATITDDASVEGFSITSGKNYITLSGKAEKGGTLPTGWIVEGLGEKECTFIIPIETANPKNGKGVSATQFYPTIELDDGQHTDVTQNLSFFVDNDAPTMYLNDTEDGTPDDAISVLNKSKLRLTDYNGLVVGSDNVVENSDGQYSFGDSIKEAGSGLAYVAVWFRKEKAGVGYWYNAIETKTATGTSINHGGNGVKIDSTNVKINDENLPVKVLTDCARPALNQIANASLAGYTDFGVGSLVKIGGSYHLITDKGEGGTSGTITIDDDVDLSFTTVEMVYANVVNHQVAEGFESGWTVSNDDGDGFVEMVKQSGNNYKWQATLRSDFIPDGPVQIHVVAFDEAGNVNSGYVETSIQNNRPRISKVFLGTDLNGNGKFDYFSETASGAVAANNELYPGYAGNGTEFGELSFYSALSSDGKIQGNVTLKSSNFVAKDKLLVLPEIIGGNTTSTKDLKYLYKVVDKQEDATITRTGIGSGTLQPLYTAAGALSLADKAGTAQKVADLLAENHKADKWNYYDTTQGDYKGEDNTHGGVVTGKYKGLVLENDTLENYESWTSGQAAGKVKYFAFTIWDATEGTEQGKTSLYALLKIPMVVNVVDDIAPKAVIHPFYWNSKEDGSFCYDEEGNPEGHIDILSAADEVKTSAKPGVSGQVWIKATVEDETRLTKATFTDPGSTKATIANYTDGKWVPVTSGLPAHWKKVEILDAPEPNQAGHKMTFRVAIDMTKYGLSLSESVNVGAVDKNTNASSNDTVQTIKKALTSHYEMKFVPYIKSIYPASESSASRSRLGKFPVQAGKPMVIEGMNFAAGAEYWVSFYKTGENQSGTETAEAAINWGEYVSPSDKEDGKITVDAPENSRWVKVWIKLGNGWIGTMNNENENGGYNVEEGYVAGEVDKLNRPTNGFLAANKAGTNFWTDDRYIAVWNVPDETLFKGSINPHSGVIKKVSEQNSGSGWTTQTSGIAAAPGGGYLYKQPGQNTQVDPITGMNDSYYAAISSDDLKLYGYVSGEDYSTLNHGDNIAYGSSEVAYFAPVDEMDYTIVNGMPYYVYQDNSLGGDSGSVWGLGLSIAREGTFYSRTYFNTGKGNTIEEEKLPFIVERQGYNLASHKRNSITGYDSVLYQFKNPRIAGWFDASDELLHNSGTGAKVQGVDLIYVSYYDSYAKCLKYAAYRIGHRITTKEGNYAHVGLQEWGKFDVDHDLDIVAEMTSSPNLRKWDDTADVATSSNQPEQKSFNHMTDGATVVAGNDTTSNNPTFSEVAGEWSDVFVDSTTPSDPRPVIIYYNKKAKSLEVAYGNKKFPEGKSDWMKSTGIRPIGVKSDFGRYVSAAMDKDGNLHVAAQDADTAKLYYLYLTKSGSSYSVTKSVAVDASNGAGRWTDIELTDPSATGTGKTLADIAPVISYIDTSFMGTTKGVKAAYVVDVEEDGTPIFEAMTDPARYSASDQRTSVMADVKETKAGSVKAPVAVGFNSDMLALDFLRAEE